MTDTISVTDEAVERSYAAADDDWRDRASSAITRCASKYAEFTTDEVWAEGLEQPLEGRALGGVMRRAARDGIIKKTDRVRLSTNPIRHRRPMAVWQSMVAGDVA